MLTTHQLQVIDHPEIFASGDCAVIDTCPRPSAGVWAVRAAIPWRTTFRPPAKKSHYGYGDPSDKLYNCWVDLNEAGQQLGPSGDH